MAHVIAERGMRFQELISDDMAANTIHLGLSCFVATAFVGGFQYVVFSGLSTGTSWYLLNLFCCCDDLQLREITARVQAGEDQYLGKWLQAVTSRIGCAGAAFAMSLYAVSLIGRVKVLTAAAFDISIHLINRFIEFFITQVPLSNGPENRTLLQLIGRDNRPAG